MSAAARALTSPGPTAKNVLGGISAAALALIAGAAATVSIQAAAALALLVLLLAARKESRTGGLMLLWAYWLLTPWLRRVFDVVDPAPSADPLSLLPFLGTAMLAAMELWENRLDRRARWILGLAAAGIAVGVPVGLAVDPAAAGFAVVAYGAGLSAFVLGWGDGVRGMSIPTLYRALSVFLPPLAIYGVAQYFATLTSWDAQWVESGGLGSLGAPQEGHIRVFSTLNSPFTFAIVLAAGILLGLRRKQSWRQALVGSVPLVVALGLTFMRSAWLGLTIGLIVFAAAVRGRVAKRVIGVVVVSIVGLIVVGGSNSTTRAFTERVTSLGSPGNDVSAQSRLERTNQLVPVALRQPLGAGAGQSGLSSERLGGSTEEFLTTVDDGYLSFLYQSGPFGFLLLATALVASLMAAIHGLERRLGMDRQAQAALLGTIAMLLLALAGGEVLFGVSGAILWYLCGLAVASARRRRSTESALESP